MSDLRMEVLGNAALTNGVVLKVIGGLADRLGPSVLARSTEKEQEEAKETIAKLVETTCTSGPNVALLVFITYVHLFVSTLEQAFPEGFDLTPAVTPPAPTQGNA